MVAVVYLSEANIEFKESDLSELESFAESKNRDLNITGYLSFQRERFIQYIEGEESDIQSLVESIKKDDRHTILHKIQRNHFGERIFPNWGMRLIKREELQKFQLELQIEQNLIFIKNDFAHKDRCEKFLWQHVELISKVRALRGKMPKS